MQNVILHALDCYRKGFEKPIDVASYVANSKFDQILQMHIGQRVTIAEQMLMRKCSSARKQGLQAARLGNLKTARQSLAEAREVINWGDLSPEGNLICQSFQLAAEAYIDYKYGDFDQAREKINQALHIDVELISKHNYDILHLHRVQLAHNIMRVEARRFCIIEALSIGLLTLEYLHGRTVTMPIPGKWTKDQLLPIPKSNIISMIVQVASELALILADVKVINRKDLHGLFSINIHKHNQHLDFYHPRVLDWLELKRKFISSDSTMFFQLLPEFLSAGREEIPVLWYSAVSDFIYICTKLNICNPDVNEIIKSDVNSWEYVPDRLLNFINTIFPESNVITV